VWGKRLFWDFDRGPRKMVIVWSGVVMGSAPITGLYRRHAHVVKCKRQETGKVCVIEAKGLSYRSFLSTGS
jgi:hypothetical protein